MNSKSKQRASTSLKNVVDLKCDNRNVLDLNFTTKYETVDVENMFRKTKSSKLVFLKVENLFLSSINWKFDSLNRTDTLKGNVALCIRGSSKRRAGPKEIQHTIRRIGRFSTHMLKKQYQNAWHSKIDPIMIDKIILYIVSYGQMIASYDLLNQVDVVVYRLIQHTYSSTRFTQCLWSFFIVKICRLI